MAKIQIRRSTRAEWVSANPVLALGELGYERDTGMVRMGDGVTPFVQLFGTKLGMNTAFSAAETFDAIADGLVTASPNWNGLSRSAVTQYPSVASGQSLRSGTPGGGDWADGALWATPSDYLAQYAQIDIPVLIAITGAAFSGSPPPGVIVRSPVVPTSFSPVGDVSRYLTYPPMLCAGISTTTWWVYLANPASLTTSSGTSVATGTGTFTSGGSLRLSITADDVATLTYGGATLWTSPGPVSGVHRPPSVSTMVGYMASRSAARVDNFVAGKL